MTSSADTPAAPADLVRRLMRERPTVALGTMLPDGAPYVSLALVALAHDASPLLLLSRLAEHTRNLDTDPRISLLFDGTAGLASPLTGPRASVQGIAARSDDELLAQRFVQRHPDAATYAGFADFGLFRVTVQRAHLVAGFGRIHWVEGADLLLDTTPHHALATAEAGILRHMNEDHADAVDLYAAALSGSGAGWALTGVDPEGADLRRGGQVLRLPFPRPVGDAGSAREALVDAVRRARDGTLAAG
ncbi:HugZ family pyridoxamine 5'-phosphate oxidase [Geminicoccus flavidas]|uniref:HugZ family pyridoxamine 5'-phosphate oxidase n=1 Tax=Geminicoccus flavidas TaxID=2506407 RepID=UPI0013591118|nr:DUF2470 domain-containing protein [Geminicoccus flavidas]